MPENPANINVSGRIDLISNGYVAKGKINNEIR